jgi:endoglucanase
MTEEFYRKGDNPMRIVRAMPIAIMLLLGGVSCGFAQYVFVNQAGYLPDQKKLAYSIDGADSFYVIDATSGVVRFSGPLVETSSHDPATGWTTYVADFSSFTADGTYRIATSGYDTSYDFQISKNVFEDVFKKSLKGFYFQRCGTALLAQNAGVYARSICHTNDAFFHSSTGQSGSKVTTGGWHDAGDYGKYVVNAGISVGTLLLAYELFPDKFSYDDLNIPESGNGIPDILDEARYELNWLLEMQDTTDGGVYFKVTTEQFDAFEMPSQDTGTRYIYQKSSTATGDLAAVMAQAARLYAPYDSVFASRCLAAAKLAWQYLSSNPTIVPAGGFKNPAGTGTGEYGDSDDSDERLWAAAELFVTTGADSFHTYFKNHNNPSYSFTSVQGWQNVASMAQLAYLTGQQPKADSTIKAQMKTALKNECESFVKIASSDGLNVALSTSDYFWGSNGYDLNKALLLIVGFKLLGDSTFYNTALEQLNYVLGCNVKNMSYVTGVGSAPPMHIHHRPSAADGIVDPIPGLMAGGPDHGLDDATLQSLYTSTTPPARCYVDNQNSYASNEIAINWNAPLVFVSGYFNESQNTSIGEVPSARPDVCELLQNFPNPFNPVSTISYRISRVSHVALKVYDMLGRQLATLVDKKQNAGSYTVKFDAGKYASGVYFYRIEVVSDNGEKFSATKKLVLLK